MMKPSKEGQKKKKNNVTFFYEDVSRNQKQIQDF